MICRLSSLICFCRFAILSMIFWLLSEVCNLCDSEKMFEDIFLAQPLPVMELVVKANTKSTIKGKVHLLVGVNNNYKSNLKNKTPLQTCIEQMLVQFESVRTYFYFLIDLIVTFQSLEFLRIQNIYGLPGRLSAVPQNPSFLRVVN